MARVVKHMKVRVDAAFTTQQREKILQAFQAWETATSGILSFELVWDVPKPGPFKDFESPGKDAGLFFWSLAKTEQQGTPALLEDWKKLWGQMDFGDGENSGNILVFEDVPEDKFYAVALHEVGHLVGMEHEADDAWAVMEPHARGNCIAAADAQQICRLYGCTPKAGCVDPSAPKPPPPGPPAKMALLDDLFCGDGEQELASQVSVDQGGFQLEAPDLKSFGLKLVHKVLHPLP